MTSLLNSFFCLLPSPAIQRLYAMLRGEEQADTFRRDLHPDLRADYVLATAPRESAKSKTALICRACRRQDNHMPFNDSGWFRKDDDVRWQWSEMGKRDIDGKLERVRERARTIQYGVPPRGNANFAWVQHFIHYLAPHGMAGFVLVRFWFWLKSRAAAAIKVLDNSTSVSFRESRRHALFVEGNGIGSLRSLN